MGEASAPRRKPKKRRSSEPAISEESPQAEVNRGTPFFLDNNSPGIPPRYSVSRYTAQRVAMLNRTGGSEVFPPLAVDAPSLLLQTVIVPGIRTNEGTVIEAVALPWFDIIALLKDDPNIAYQLTADKWEEIIAGVYKKAGFDEVVLTPRSGDHGRDVIAIKKGVCKVRVIDQVKAYKPPHLVTANDVRALMGVLQTDGASKGCLTTTSDFAPKIKMDPLIVPLIPSRLELVNA